MSSDESDTRTRILEATWRLLERHRGQGVSMGAIAKAAGISRQAVYLHFGSRTELMIATTHYVDEVKGLAERLAPLQATTSGIARLEACVEIWGRYIPEIHAIAKALLQARETDEAAAEAWEGSMGCLGDVCRDVVEALDRDGCLAPGWSHEEAVDMMWTLLSIQNWEQLIHERGWSTPRYINHMKTLLRRSFVEAPAKPDIAPD